MVGYSYRRIAMADKPSAIEYLTTTRIGEKGQLTVPKEFRDDLGLKLGAPFAVLRIGDGLILLPEQRRFEQLCQRLGAALSGATEEVLRTLPEARERVLASRYKRSSRARRRSSRRRVANKPPR
jgi:AbrB family looped-hinge helix DNA binding protein